MAGKRQRKKGDLDIAGRNATGRFVRLPLRLLTSNAYRSLSPNARSLLVELDMLNNGSNNGSLYLSVRDAAARMGISDLSAATKAFDELIEMGFIEMTQDAHFRVKAADKSRARCWRLTWLAGPGRKAPSWDMLDREPSPKTKEHRRMDRGLRALKRFRKDRDLGRLPVVDCDTLAVYPPVSAPRAVSDSDTAKCENGSFAPNPLVRDNATHSADHGGRGQAVGRLSLWWKGDQSRLTANLVYFATLSASQRSELQ